MDITEVKVFLQDKGKLRAYANITIDDCFAVRGLKVIDGDNGFYVAMPNYRKGSGKFQDVAYPINRETHVMIENLVLNAFEDALNAEQNNV